MRCLLTTDEDPPFASIFKNTSLLVILDTVFSFQSEPGDVFFMKLECFWILNNLACCHSDQINYLLGDGALNGIAKGETLRKISVELERI